MSPAITSILSTDDSSSEEEECEIAQERRINGMPNDIDLLNIVSMEVHGSFYPKGPKLVCNDNHLLLKFIKLEECPRHSVDVNIDYIKGTKIDDDRHDDICDIIIKGKIHSTLTHNNSNLVHLSSISVLKSLDLAFLDVNGEVIELLLSRCLLLEELRIIDSDDLIDLKVPSSAKSLKSLKIMYCRKIKQLEIHSPNLTSLILRGNKKIVNVVYGNVPSLVHVVLIDYTSPSLALRFKEMQSYSLQLTKLSLCFDKLVDKDLVVPTIPQLKHLELRIINESHNNLLPLKNFVEACPMLQKISMQIDWICECAITSAYESEAESEDEHVLDSEEYALEDVQDWLKQENGSCTLPHLRKFELIGAFHFYSHIDYELPLVLYIIKNAIKLENFVCNISYPKVKIPEFADFVNDQRLCVAQQLAKVIPSTVEVEII